MCLKKRRPFGADDLSQVHFVHSGLIGNASIEVAFGLGWPVIGDRAQRKCGRHVLPPPFRFKGSSSFLLAFGQRYKIGDVRCLPVSNVIQRTAKG